MPRFEVDVIIEDVSSHPSCQHGPTLLFEKFKERGEIVRYFACSACRDRKDCSFYMPVEIWLKKQGASENRQEPEFDQQICRISDIRASPASERYFCQTCNQLFVETESRGHKDHEIISDISEERLQRPSKLLTPLSDPKKEAQYLFSGEEAECLLKKNLMKAGITRVLCVGCPRLHEYLRTNSSMETLMMDLDLRYRQFYDRKEFLQYNMFNHHFFGGDGDRKTYLKFLKREGGAAVVVDPPFGGRVEVLAHTLRLINEDWKSRSLSREQEDIGVVWVFPYFMAPRVKEFAPSLQMLDYRVDYENHPLFQKHEKGRKYGSPVRLFTNLDPSKFKLPKSDYRLCSLCVRWVSKDNQHCDRCQNCTSKDGRPWIHCELCNTCVKSSWAHCTTCQKCRLPDHRCDQMEGLCHRCQQPGHKRKECPQLHTKVAKRTKKRKKRLLLQPSQKLQRTLQVLKRKN